MLSENFHRVGGTKRRLGVVVIACACLLGQLSAFAHRALVQHVTCAEHGESIHVSAAPPPGSVVPSSERIRAGAVPQMDVVPLVAASDHDHCSVVLSRALVGQFHSAGGVGLLPPGNVLDSSHHIAAVSGTATYLLAPKTSPPRRA